MKRSFNLSAAQMALLNGFGCLIAASGFLLLAFVKKLFAYGSLPFWLSLVLATVLIILGFVISVKATFSLRQGVQAERWPSEKIAALRHMTTSSWWTSVGLAFILVFVLTFLVSFSSPFHSLWWIGFIFLQGMTQLQRALRQDPPANSSFSSPSLQLDWHSAAPLHSNHWGQH